MDFNTCTNGGSHDWHMFEGRIICFVCKGTVGMNVLAKGQAPKTTIGKVQIPGRISEEDRKWAQPWRKQ